MARKKRHKARGHYCWACDRVRSNEKFSGAGHRRHLCKDCAARPKDELHYVQALRNLERCVTWDGLIRRRQRKAFERFLVHENPRIRALAAEFQEEDRLMRSAMRHSNDDPFAELCEFIESDTDCQPKFDDQQLSDEIPF